MRSKVSFSNKKGFYAAGNTGFKTFVIKYLTGRVFYNCVCKVIDKLGTC